MNYQEQAIISFNTNPFDWIEEGIKIAKDVNPSRMQSRKDAMSDSASQSNAGANFYGYKPSDNLTFDQQMDRYVGLGQYYNLDILKSVESYLQNINDFIDLGGNLSKAKIKYSSIPRGIFDFNRASKGLIRPVEYYCESLNKLIDPNLVRLKNYNGKDENYFTDNDEELFCEARQEGTTKLLKTFPSALKKYFLGSNKIFIPVDLKGNRVTKMGDLSLRFTSTEKKVYAFRETLGGGVAPYVDLFVQQGSNGGGNGEYMFIQVMPLIMLGSILEQAGVKTRIWTADYYSNSYKPIAHHLLIKEYGESYDTNKMGLFTSDPRIFRYLGWNALLGQNYKISKANNKINDDIPIRDNWWGGQGSCYSTENIMQDFSIYKNFYESYQKEGLIPQSQVKKELMIFGGTNMDGLYGSAKFFNSDGSLNDEVKDAVFESFYLLADYVSLTLSKTPARVLSAISQRLTDEGKKTNERDEYFRSFFNTITNNTSYTQPYSGTNINMIRGSSTLEEISEGREKRLAMAEILNQFITDNNLKITI
jgi:hypothetical protein